MESCPGGRLWYELWSCLLPDAEEACWLPSPMEFALSSWSRSNRLRRRDRWVSVDCSSFVACVCAFGRGWQSGGKSRMAIGPSGMVVAVGVVRERRSMPRARRRLERELEVDGVFELSYWSAWADFDEVSCRVDLTRAIGVDFERAVSTEQDSRKWKCECIS